MSNGQPDAFEREVERATASSHHREDRCGYTQILVAYDGSADARAALERVAAVATADPKVTVITVIPYEAVGSKLDPIEQSDRDWQWHCLVEATAYLRGSGIDPFIEAAAGNPAPVISARPQRASKQTWSCSATATEEAGAHPSVEILYDRPSRSS